MRNGRRDGMVHCRVRRRLDGESAKNDRATPPVGKSVILGDWLRNFAIKLTIPMNIREFVTLFSTSAAFVVGAADLPEIPAEPIARKVELLFSDDFEGAQPAAVWHKVVPTFTVEKGTLKGT